MASLSEPTTIVSRGYNTCSAAYTSTRALDTVPELSLLISRLPAEASILDLGCGAGVPIASTLAAHGFSITGIDISDEQIRQARVNVPSGKFMCADMLASDLFVGQAGFDAVVAMFSIFHLPRSRHAEVLDKIRSWLKPGGLLLMTTTVDKEDATLADNLKSHSSAAPAAPAAPAANHKGEDGVDTTGSTTAVEDRNSSSTGAHEEGATQIFYGAEMYWSSWEHVEYKKLLEARGFQVLENTAVVDGGEEKVFEFADSHVDVDKPGRRPRLLLASKTK